MKYHLNPQIDKTLPYGEAIFKSRGIKDIETYLSPTRKVLQDPLILDNITIGTELLEYHIACNNEILIVVDCDMDGICSAAMLWNYIKAYQPMAKLDFIMHEGKQHGLEDIIDKIEDKNYKLVIIPDAGSNDYEYHEQLAKLLIDVLVIDHHEAEKYSSNAIVINNQLSRGANKTLSGAGVVFKFLQVMDTIWRQEEAENYLDLAAAAIIADVMQLQELETRYIIHRGLNNIQNFGLKTFVDKQSYSLGGKLTPIGIGFYIAPIVNAVIRIGTMEEKELLFRAFICGQELEPSTKRGHKPGDTEIIAEKAFRVGKNCHSRQNKLKSTGTNLILDTVYANGLDEYPIIFVSLDDFESKQIPQELTGLVAMQVCSTLGRPTLIGRIGDGNRIKGSIRNNSNGALSDLKAFLTQSKYFDFVEGHANAAGFSIPQASYEKFLEYSKEALKNIQFNENTYEVDYEFNRDNIEEIVEIANIVNINKEIWGNNITEPRIAIKGLTFSTENVLIMGANKDSAKLSVNNIEIVRFKDTNFTDSISDCTSFELTAIGRLSINEWGGKSTSQFIIEDYDLTTHSKYDF